MRGMVVRAGAMSALLATLFELSNHTLQHLMYPAGRLTVKLVGRGFPLGPGEDGLMANAWLLGPIAFIVNTFVSIPLTLALSYVSRRSKILVKVWDLVLLTVGGLVLFGGASSGLLLIVGVVSGEYPSDLFEHYFINFVVLPAILSGTVSVVAFFWLSRGRRSRSAAS